MVCVYERADPPCEEVATERAEEIAFGPRRRYQRRRPDERGSYRIEERPAPRGGQERLIRFDDGPAAQLTAAGDTLVISWAYVDGAERRYVRIPSGGD